MKKFLTIVLSAVMMLSLAACGGEKSENSGTSKKASSQGNESKNTSASKDSESENTSASKDSGSEDTSASQGNESESTPASQGTAAEIEPAKDGELTLSRGNIAVVVNGKTVLMPYNLLELEAAGVPVSEIFREDELASGDSFSLNLYLDENDDYVLIPDYYNDGDDTVALTNAEAKTITMVSYASEPVDQGVSLLGVTYGMAKSDVKAMLGEPMSDEGDYCEWQIVVTDADYVGNLSIYFTGDTDDAGACEIRLDFMEW